MSGYDRQERKSDQREAVANNSTNEFAKGLRGSELVRNQESAVCASRIE